MSLDMKKFLENRATISPDQLARYRGKFLAWSQDGARIIASADREDDLDRIVRAAGERPEECVFSAVPDIDTIIGGTEVS